MVGSASKIISKKLSLAIEGKDQELGKKEWDEIILALGEVAAGVADEIRNPLTGIKGFTQLLKSQYKPGEREWKYVNTILTEADKIETMIEELLMLSRPTFPRKRWADVRKIIDEILPVVAKDVVDNRVTIITNYDEKVAYMKLDVSQMKIVLFHLMKSCIQTMYQGGQLIIDVVQSREMSTNEISFTIKADVNREEQKKIFKAWFAQWQGNSNLSRTVNQRIIENHHGALDIFYDEKQGHKIIIKLPLLAEKKQL